MGGGGDLLASRTGVGFNGFTEETYIGYMNQFDITEDFMTQNKMRGQKHRQITNIYHRKTCFADNKFLRLFRQNNKITFPSKQT